MVAVLVVAGGTVNGGWLVLALLVKPVALREAVIGFPILEGVKSNQVEMALE
jgi:hypothetical protein